MDEGVCGRWRRGRERRREGGGGGEEGVGEEGEEAMEGGVGKRG